MIQHDPFNADAERRSRSRGLSVRPGFLLALLGVLAAGLFVRHTNLLGSAQAGGGCQGDGAPRLLNASGGDLAGLREGLARVIPGRIGELYEEGTITSANAWTDNSPEGPPLSPATPRPAGYEMRWWAPNRDDVVADVFVFQSDADARRFYTQALGGSCRRDATQVAAVTPVSAHNLYWVNPESLAQEDVYLQRGQRVYRIADVQAGAKEHDTPLGRERGFELVDRLACRLPGAGCGSPRGSVTL